MASPIRELRARQVWDSRGRPTVEAEIVLASGSRGRSIAPSGASTGRREALDLRDGGARLGGFGVERALAGLRELVAPALLGGDPADQAGLDRRLLDLDGTAQKTRLGGNALVAVSCALAAAAAADRGVPLWQHLRTLAGLPEFLPHLPTPMIQIFGGGRHAGNRIDVQDFLVLCPGARSFAEAVEWTAEVYFAALAGMAARGKRNGVADEGGVWPDFAANEEGLEELTRAIHAAGFTKGEVGIALDVAASSFASGGRYRLALEGRELGSEQMVEMLEGWARSYPILSLEDPVSEDDDAGMALITRRLGRSLQIVGDDYLVTSAERIARAVSLGACNTALLKANQCGTLTELIAASAAARRAGWNTVMSGRSGESEDTTLSHLAVGLLADGIKVGSMTRSERTAKWNEVIRIEEALGGGFRPFRLPGASA